MTDPLFNPSALHVLKLVSGLPKTARERRLILVLQAFIDDSRSAGEVLVLSGFISDALSWAKFSDQWQELLDGLRWPSFKMSNLAYGGGDITTEQASWFYRVAENHARHSVTIAIDERMLRKFVEDARIPPAHNDPYYIALPAIMKSLMVLERDIAFSQPIEVIFDKQSQIERPFLRMWDEVYPTLSDREKVIFANRPRFEHDEHFLPLQAADLQAYWMREHCRRGGSLTKITNPYPWKIKYNTKCIMITPTENEIRRSIARIRSEYVKMARDRHLVDNTISDDALDFRGSTVEWLK